MPHFSIVIPVLNEGIAIGEAIAAIESLSAAEPPEIIVVDGDPEGGTIRHLREGRVRTAFSGKGRAAQMNRGAELAEGNILVFLHADTRLPVDAPALIEAALSHPSISAGAFDLKIESDRPAFRMIETFASLRSRLTRIPYGDQALFFRAAYFREIGGFAGIPIMEDVEIMRRIKKREERITIIDTPVATSARRWEKEGILFCTLRNWFLVSLYFAGVRPERLSGFYR